MARVNAAWVVTHMKNMVPESYLSFVEIFKRKSMRKHLSALFRAPKKTVSDSVFVGCPLPAHPVVLGGELVEKSYVSWVSFSYHNTIMGNEFLKVKGVQ